MPDDSQRDWPQGRVEQEGLLRDDEALVAGILAGDARAQTELFRRYGRHVHRVLLRVLGPDNELADVVHEVFISAFGSIKGLREPSRLKAWLSQITVLTARKLIRRRQRGRWLRLLPELPDIGHEATAESTQIAAREVLSVLEQMPADLRIAFALRFIDHMELSEVADACKCSMATIKRRLQKAELRFRKLATRHPALNDELEQRVRWGRT